VPRVVLNVWHGVPDAEKLRAQLDLARSAEAPLLERQGALGYLTGAAKVLAKIESRQPVATHLQQQIREIKKSLYYARGEVHEQDNG